jgi:hypothetical protein
MVLGERKLTLSTVYTFTHNFSGKTAATQYQRV